MRNKKAVVQLKVRMREPLRAKLEKAAKQKGISLNAEIVERLKSTVTVDEMSDEELRVRANKLGYALFV
jgi:Arc-like DNA binding domain